MCLMVESPTRIIRLDLKQVEMSMLLYLCSMQPGGCQFWRGCLSGVPSASSQRPSDARALHLYGSCESGDTLTFRFQYSKFGLGGRRQKYTPKIKYRNSAASVMERKRETRAGLITELKRDGLGNSLRQRSIVTSEGGYRPKSGYMGAFIGTERI